MQRLIGILLLFVVITAFQQPQKRKGLEEKRKKLITEIAVTSKLLQKTKKDSRAAVDRLYVLQNQIQNRHQLLQNLQEEINVTNVRIDRDYEVVELLQRDIAGLKTEYGKMIRNTWRFKARHHPLMFILSADSFSQSFRRWQFLKQYDRYRRRQALMIRQTQATLTGKILKLQEQKNEKEVFVSSMTEQNQLLGTEISQKEQLVKSLKKDMGRLETDLTEKQKKHEELNGAIEGIIMEEMRLQRETAKGKTTAVKSGKDKTPDKKETKSSGASADTPENIALSNDFWRNKGKLPWPATGIITKRFGKQPHPTLRNVQISNNGIDIRTETGADVKSVFAGEVVGIQFIPGFHNTVILRHGNYYTVYSNLDAIYVSKGQAITMKQPIGKVSVDYNSNVSELHFELWREKVRQNPAAWIR